MHTKLTLVDYKRIRNQLLDTPVDIFPNYTIDVLNEVKDYLFKDNILGTELRHVLLNELVSNSDNVRYDESSGYLVRDNSKGNVNDKVSSKVGNDYMHRPIEDTYIKCPHLVKPIYLRWSHYLCSWCTTYQGYIIVAPHYIDDCFDLIKSDYTSCNSRCNTLKDCITYIDNATR